MTEVTIPKNRMAQKGEPFTITKIPQLVHVQEFLDDTEIKILFDSVKGVEKTEGRITVNDKNDGYRDVGIQVVGHDKDGVADVVMKIMKTIEHANNRFWNFSIKGIMEDIQLLTYKKNQQYKLHSDILWDYLNSEHPNRKLTFILQLSDEKSYEGGKVVLHNDEMGEMTIDRKKGSLVFFPAFIPHKVYPIKSGTRKSIIGWIAGDAWK